MLLENPVNLDGKWLKVYDQKISFTYSKESMRDEYGVLYWLAPWKKVLEDLQQLKQ